MKRLAAIALIVVLATTGLLGIGHAGEPTPPRLRFNPFERPDLDALTAAHEHETSSAALQDWTPVLKGTLLGRGDSLANLGGVILRRGEETHGYRLVEVRQWEAVFLHDGERIVLSVDSQGGR